MLQKTNEVQQAEAALSIARIHRNKIFYRPQAGMAHIISEAKKYIIGLYGHASQQHQTIRRFKIRKQDKLTFY